MARHRKVERREQHFPHVYRTFDVRWPAVNYQCHLTLSTTQALFEGSANRTAQSDVSAHLPRRCRQEFERARPVLVQLCVLQVWR